MALGDGAHLSLAGARAHRETNGIIITHRANRWTVSANLLANSFNTQTRLTPYANTRADSQARLRQALAH